MSTLVAALHQLQAALANHQVELVTIGLRSHDQVIYLAQLLQEELHVRPFLTASTSLQILGIKITAETQA